MNIQVCHCRLRLLRVAVILVVLACPPFAHAEDIDDAWPIGSAMEVGQRHVKTRDHFVLLLTQQNTQLAELLVLVGNQRLNAALVAQHDAWLKYRDAECEVFGTLSGAGGSWPSTHAVECEARLTEHRFRRARNANACVRKIAVVDRSSSTINHCLQPLLPLNLK